MEDAAVHLKLSSLLFTFGAVLRVSRLFFKKRLEGFEAENAINFASASTSTHILQLMIGNVMLLRVLQIVAHTH